MKIACAIAFAAVAASTSFAADVNVIGSGNLRASGDLKAISKVVDMKPMASDDTDVVVMGAPMPQTVTKTDVRVAAKDLLNNPTALINKNTLATDNNIFISRSNLIFTQSDRLAMRQKVRDVINRARMQKQSQKQEDHAMSTATLTKDVLRAVSASDKDSAVMSKASAVVAAKDADTGALAQRIADFVDAAGKSEMDKEQSIQSQTPRGVMVLVGTKDLVRQPTGVINKNKAQSDNQVVISRSNLTPTQNDQVVLTGGAKVADAVMPASAVNVDKITQTEAVSEPLYRQAVLYSKDTDMKKDSDTNKGMDMDTDAKKQQEQWGLGWGGGLGAGWGLGWRYPLGYWNTFGAGLYGGGCGLGFPMGGFYYC